MPDGTEYTRDPLLRSYGKVLRVYREASGLSRPQLAQALGCAPGWIEKLETGQRPPSEATSRDLDVYFDTKVETFLTLWLEIKREGKHLASPPGFTRYTELEAQALGIWKYSVQAVPAMLQTPEYARAILSIMQSDDSLEDRVAARMERQQLLTREKPPRTGFVLDEAVLRRPVGGPEVMWRQLERLAQAVSAEPNLQVRILPFSSLTYAALDGPFTVLNLPRGVDVAYHEGPEISYVIEEAATVTEYEVRFSLVMGEALRGSESLDFIKRVMEDYK